VLGRVGEGAGFVCVVAVVVVVGCAFMAGVLLEEWDAWLGEAGAGDCFDGVELEAVATSTPLDVFGRVGEGAGFVCVVVVVVVGCAFMAGVLLEEWDAWLGEAGTGDCFDVVELEVDATFT